MAFVARAALLLVMYSCTQEEATSQEKEKDQKSERKRAWKRAAGSRKIGHAKGTPKRVSVVEHSVLESEERFGCSWR